MKKLTCLMLACLFTVLLFTACTNRTDAPTPTKGAGEETTAESRQTTEAVPETTQAPQEEVFDPAAFWTELNAAHPEAGAEELCAAMLESPYFTMYQQESTEYWYPGLNFESAPKGVRESACIVDYMSGSGSVFYVLIPEEGADPAALEKSLLDNSMADWMDFEHPLEQRASMVIDGKVFFALYRDGMTPVTGPIAEKPRDFIEMFHAELARQPERDCLTLANYFAGHQKICSMFCNQVEEGQLTGFGSFDGPLTEIKGFAEGATFAPQMSPSTFIGYVFRLEEGADADAFIAMLRENANLAWNVCVEANTILTEADGNFVLFMMCTE